MALEAMKTLAFDTTNENENEIFKLHYSTWFGLGQINGRGLAMFVCPLSHKNGSQFEHYFTSHLCLGLWSIWATNAIGNVWTDIFVFVVLLLLLFFFHFYFGAILRPQRGTQPIGMYWNVEIEATIDNQTLLLDTLGSHSNAILCVWCLHFNSVCL